MNRWESISPWLALGNVPTASTTICGTLIGYFTVTDRIDADVVVLGVLILLFHFSIFSLNDVYDRKLDRFANRPRKPLVSGTIQASRAKRVSYGILSIALLVSAFVFPWKASFMLYAGSAIGIVYNILAGRTSMGPFLLGIWAILAVYFGALIAGAPNVKTGLLALLTSVILVHLTYTADIFELEEDAYSLPKYLGVEATPELSFSTQSVLFEGLLISLKLLIVTAIVSHGRLIGIIAGVPLLAHIGYNVQYLRLYNSLGDQFYSTLFSFARTGILTLILALTAFVDIWLVAALVAFTLLWGFAGRLILFGSIKKHA